MLISRPGARAQARATRMLRTYVLDNVRQRIEAGHQGFVNEIRVCTCLFLGLPWLSQLRAPGEVPDELRCMQAAAELVQQQARSPELPPKVVPRACHPPSGHLPSGHAPRRGLQTIMPLRPLRHAPRSSQPPSASPCLLGSKPWRHFARTRRRGTERLIIDLAS